MASNVRSIELKCPICASTNSINIRKNNLLIKKLQKSKSCLILGIFDVLEHNLNALNVVEKL